MPSHWLLPPDPTPEEKQIFRYSVLNIYNKFDDPIDKFIIMAKFEANYPQKLIAEMVGRREQAISIRIKKIKTVLSQSHKAYIKP